MKVDGGGAGGGATAVAFDAALAAMTNRGHRYYLHRASKPATAAAPASRSRRAARRARCTSAPSSRCIPSAGRRRVSSAASFAPA